MLTLIRSVILMRGGQILSISLTGVIRERSLFMGGRGPEILGRRPLIFGKSLKGVYLFLASH